MAAHFSFDPHRVADAEAAGWRAYYDRDWLRLLRLIVSLSQAQFRIPFPASWRAAYHIVRASIAWAPRAHDLGVVRSHLERYYRIARRYSGLGFDPARAAALEVRYWDVHRRLAMAGQTDKSEFVAVLAGLHAEVFGLSPQQTRESAEWRVRANNTVDGITAGASRDVEADWASLQADLRRCYRSLRSELESLTGRVPAGGTGTSPG
jgi:hypothetical protein